jgi:acetyl esterase/lipase
MTHRRSAQLVAVLAIVGVVAAACGSSETPSSSAVPARSATPGGTSLPAAVSGAASASAGNVVGSGAPASGATASTCGTAGSSPCPTVPVALARNVPFTPPVDCGGGTQCQIQLDVSYPAPGTQGGPWPVIVAIPGGPEPLGGRVGLEGLAYGLAAQGTVVYLADYRSMPNQDAGFPQTFQDVACAVSFARATASTYGGASSGPITLVGGSFGGWVGAVVAFTPQPFPLSAANCLQPSASSRPDAFVGVAGIYSLDQIDPGYLTGFFGGTRQAQPGAWAAGDPYVIVPANRNETIPVRLVAGSKDTVGSAISQQTFFALLQASGYNVTLTMIPGANHAGVFESPVTPETIMGLVRRRP